MLSKNVHWCFAEICSPGKFRHTIGMRWAQGRTHWKLDVWELLCWIQHLRHHPPQGFPELGRQQQKGDASQLIYCRAWIWRMGKDGKLDPTIGRNEGKYMLPISNLMRLYYFQKFEERFRTSFQLLCRWLLLPENGITVSWGWTGWDLPSPQQK